MNVKADADVFVGKVKVNSESEKDIVLAGVYVKGNNGEFGS